MGSYVEATHCTLLEVHRAVLRSKGGTRSFMFNCKLNDGFQLSPQSDRIDASVSMYGFQSYGCVIRDPWMELRA